MTDTVPAEVMAAIEAFCRHVDAKSPPSARLADDAKVALVAAIAKALDAARREGNDNALPLAVWSADR